MSTQHPPEHVVERVVDLQIDQAVGCIAENDLRELNHLLLQYPQLRTEEYEYAASAVERALTKDDEIEELPDQFSASMVDVLESFSVSGRDENQIEESPLRLHGDLRQSASTTRSMSSFIGWLAAAACLAIAAMLWFTRPMPVPPPVIQTASEQLQQFVESAPDLAEADWGDWDDPEIKGVTGKVYWSESQQSGFMQFAHLTPNNPTKEQYQLWIIDERGLETRVSGAIFDTDADGSAIVQIEPSIAIRNAALFAITIEQPGGVWVSDMSRRVVIASLGE
ncbi:MAG: anti-sigma factor [Phycisphaeraceae bacterium]|nr:anti-sigma factor [Phycisphaerales bacterium]MCB9858936.1 anti-sigma factor [Phycisphaeraceae bacterium]